MAAQAAGREEVGAVLDVLVGVVVDVAGEVVVDVVVVVVGLAEVVTDVGET